MVKRIAPEGATAPAAKRMNTRHQTNSIKQSQVAELKAHIEIAEIVEDKMDIIEVSLGKENGIESPPSKRPQRLLLPLGFEEEEEDDDEVIEVDEQKGTLGVPETLNDEQLEREICEFRFEMSGVDDYAHYSSAPSSTVLATSSLERDIRRDLEKYYGQECYICHIRDGKMQSCTVPECLVRFHPHCIDQVLLGEFDPYVHRVKTQCRQHHCTTCFAENLRFTAFRSLPDEKIFRCVYCTNAYHVGCVPAGCPKKGTKIICNQHYRRETTFYPHIPFCFGCRQEFSAEKDQPKECSRCLRSFHDECAQVNMRITPIENVCFYCLNNWSPRKGQLCHVFYENRFVPAQVAKTDWVEAFNTKGNVPLFLIGCGKRNSESLLQIPSCFVVPMIAYESMKNYYEQHLKDGAIFGRYLGLLEMIENNPHYLLPRPGRSKARYNNEMKNTMTQAIQRDLTENYDEVAEKCTCEANLDNLKCFSNTCLNRNLGYECRDDCGEGCMNGAKARDVTDAVEIFDAPFGGYGLRAAKVIKEGFPIGEYTGAIIDKEKTKALLNEYVTRRNQEQPLYIMAINNAFNINSAKSGRATRFANHSCDPNTMVARVLGTDNYPHQILYAKRQIEVGEPITFDYNFTWAKFNPRCYCGTPACSGHFSGRLKKKLLVESKKEEMKVSDKENGIADNNSQLKRSNGRRGRQRKEDPNYRAD